MHETYWSQASENRNMGVAKIHNDITHKWKVIYIFIEPSLLFWSDKQWVGFSDYRFWQREQYIHMQDAGGGVRIPILLIE